MLINLLPDFFAVLESTDRLAAYQRYFDNHRRILQPYWQNYVIDPETPQGRSHHAGWIACFDCLENMIGGSA